ncbi:GDP-L-fucose synthase family protein [Algisphaera agarilytica]|uniref:GDP-L-fucose synthase n=1 Tax=Algisphaera agarilytica TaxID=1385975 RepID=A0A7X0H7Q0_9BACT|nr:GDP-L-fucose synthase [Algisphaera agarilytica]MBB6430781.1 GDP-L-fucose synthase [Algisphaera agarilytica]
MSHLNFEHDRILVTGGHGFLGTQLCQTLRDRGVTADRLYAPTHAEVELTDEAQVASMYQRFKPDVIFHLAAEVGGIGANQAHPGRFFYANFAMGIHLIEQARIHGLRKFVHCGTVCAYPENATRPFTEDQFWNSYPAPITAPYGIAKLSLGVMLDGYRREYGLQSCMLIPVNLYGPNDNFDLQTAHVMPALIRKFLHAIERGEDTVSVWGSGKASREFLYVTDAADGLIHTADRVDETTPINLGSGRETPIKELAEIIADATGFKGQITWDHDKPDGQPRRCLSMERAHEQLGWSARVPLEQGVEQTVAWCKANQGDIRGWGRADSPASAKVS